MVVKAFSDEDENQSDDWQGKIMFLEKRQEKKLDELSQKSNDLKDIIIGAFQDKNSGVIDENLRKSIKELDTKLNVVDQKMSIRMNEFEKKISGLETKFNDLDISIKEMIGILKKK